MKDILVYATPFEIEKGKWGYKWIGFCYGKRFTMIQNPYATEMIIDKENGNYVISNNDQKELLPTEIKKFIYGVPVSNHYFLLDKGKNGKAVSLEVVMELIEKGYDMENIIMKKHSSIFNRNENFLCKYLEKETENIIVEIIDYETIIWKTERQVK